MEMPVDELSIIVFFASITGILIIAWLEILKQNKEFRDE